MRGFWLVAFMVTACSKPKKLTGDIDIRVGDCAPTTVAFISGPRPQPFDPDKISSEALFVTRTSGGGNATPGWGTIGYDGSRKPQPTTKNAEVPTVSIGQPNAQGDLDKAIIRRYIKRNIQKIQYCYEKQLLADAKLEGTVATQFFIKPDGNVGKATATGVSTDVAECVAAVIKGIQFPKPKGGGGVQVNYPFTFRRAGDADRDLPKPGSPTPSTHDDPPPPEDDDESGGTGTAMALDEGNMGKRDANARQQAIDQARDAGILGQTAGSFVPNYQAGATSPLSGFERELDECFRLQTKRYGVAVIDLDANKVTAHGIEHSGFKSCVAKIKIPAQKKSLRCSVAFGPMPIAEAPGIDVTATAIKVDGQLAGDPRSEVSESSHTFKIESLYEVVDARVKAALENPAPVTLHGPLVIRPINSMTMNVLNKVYATVRASGDDAVFAVQREPAKWTLLEPMFLPVQPVPRGTGVSWASANGLLDAGSDESVVLSVFVTADGIWLGLSRVNEFQKIEGDDIAKLEAALKEHKQSAFFADRTDIEIAGDGPVTYERFVKVLDAVAKQGFTSWEITDPLSLSARPQL